MKNMFESTKIGNIELKNRFIKSGVWEALATSDGYMTPELYNIYEELAKGGVGLIITGYAYVDDKITPNPNMMGIYDDSFIANYKPMVNMIHSYNAKVVMQLSSGAALDVINDRLNNNKDSGSINVLPNEFSIEEIKELVTKYINGAIRAKKAGFDGVELHVGHGYILSQFLSENNTRSDIYGGTIENKARIITDIIKGIKEINGSDFLVMVKQNSEDFTTTGLTSEDSISASICFEKAGVDMLDITGGNETSEEVLNNNLGPARRKIFNNESYFYDHAAKLSERVNVAVILTGGNRNLASLNEKLNNSNVSYFAFGRPFISEPDLVNKLNENNEYKLRCVSCNGCYFTDGKRCVLNKKK